MTSPVTESGSARRFSSRDLALVAVFVGVVAALGLVPALYPFGGAVPITAQSMGVMLVGAVLGARRALATLLVFLALVAVGLPLLAGGLGGLGAFTTPRVGFLLGFPVAAYAVGWISERGGPTYRLHWGMVANVVGGIVVLYVFGVAGIVLVARISVEAAIVSTWVFVPGDAIKAALAALVARGVHQGYPGLLTPGRGRREHVGV